MLTRQEPFCRAAAFKKTKSCIPAGKWSDTLFPAAVFSQALVVRLSLLFSLSLPAFLVPYPPSLPSSLSYTFAHTLQADGGKRCLYRRYFPLLKQPSTLQNQHGINKFNMNWKLMKCAPPPLPPGCQSPGRRLSTELLETRQRMRSLSQLHHQKQQSAKP